MGKGSFWQLEFLLSGEKRQLFGAVKSRTITLPASYSTMALWICMNNVMVNLWFITMCECGGITSLFLQTAMLYECNLMLCSWQHSLLPCAVSVVKCWLFPQLCQPYFCHRGESHCGIAPNQCCTTVEHGWELCCSWQYSPGCCKDPGKVLHASSSCVGFCLKHATHCTDIAKLSKNCLGFIFAHTAYVMNYIIYSF